MNKQLIVFLAVALLSVHAFVKRDAPDAGKVDVLDEFKVKFQEFADKLAKGTQEALNPENIKKQFNDMVDTINTAVNPKKEQPK